MDGKEKRCECCKAIIYKRRSDAKYCKECSIYLSKFGAEKRARIRQLQLTKDYYKSKYIRCNKNDD